MVFSRLAETTEMTPLKQRFAARAHSNAGAYGNFSSVTEVLS